MKEYKIFTKNEIYGIKGNKFESIEYGFNELAKEGWEYKTQIFRPYSSELSNLTVEFLFEREVKDI